MKLIYKTLLLLSALPFATASAAPEAPAQLASLTSKNLAMVSSALSAHQKGANNVATTRAAHILSIHRLSIDARQVSEREVSILKQTGGAEVLKVYMSLCEYGDNAALASGQAAEVEAAAKADIISAYAPLAISTDKLDKAAKTLAGLVKEQSAEERLKFLSQFAKNVREESVKLEKASEAKKAEADKKLDTAAEAISAIAPKNN